jgi:hypothetical protein
MAESPHAPGTAEVPAPKFPRLLESVHDLIEDADISVDEFHARREEALRTLPGDRPPTQRILATIHSLVVAEIELEYWRALQLHFSKHEDDPDYVRYERGANEAQRRLDRALAALEREERSRERERLAREKALAAEKAAREKRDFTLQRDERRFAEGRAVRIEKQKERAARDFENRLERQRRDALRAATKKSAAATTIPELGIPADTAILRDRDAPGSSAADLPSRPAALSELIERAADAVELTGVLISNPDSIASLGSPLADPANSDRSNCLSATELSANSNATSFHPEHARTQKRSQRRRRRPHRRLTAVRA